MSKHYKNPVEIETCCVADQHCLAPANVFPRRPAYAKCYICGQPVCTACSTRRKHQHYGRVRICNDCQILTFEDGEFRVLYRIARKADFDHHESVAWAEEFINDQNPQTKYIPERSKKRPLERKHRREGD